VEQINTFEAVNNLQNDLKKQLILQIGSDSFSYAVFETAEKKCLGLKQFKINQFSEIENIISAEEFLKAPFENTCVQYKSPKAVLVPSSLFDKKNLKAYLKFHFDFDDSEQIYFQEIKTQEAFLVYTIPLIIENTIKKNFTSLKFSHHSYSFLQTAFEHQKDINVSLHVHVSNNFFDVLVLKKNTIQLFNSFFCQNFNDILFFTVNILNLFSLEPENIRVYASGEINSNSKEADELRKIVKNIRFEKFRQDLSFNNQTLALEQHKYVTLLNLINCE
jgi:hypothetical protein